MNNEQNTLERANELSTAKFGQPYGKLLTYEKRYIHICLRGLE